MEKQHGVGAARLARRLLILFSILLPPLPLCAEPLLLSIRGGDIYAGAVCEFSLVIPNARSRDVHAEAPELPPDVSLVSLRRTDSFGNSGNSRGGVSRGVEISVELIFQSPGEYSLPPLRVNVRSGRLEVPFETVTVMQDPRERVPRLVVKFDNGIEARGGVSYGAPLFTVGAGAKIDFTLFLQYAVQADQLSWEVPKDALFTELRRFEMVGGTPTGGADEGARIGRGLPRDPSFSTEPVPLARFEWQPLVEGVAPIPDIRLTATAHDGGRVEVGQPAASVFVAAAPLSSGGTDGGNYFAEAFSETGVSENARIQAAISEEDCERLAFLRSKERHSFFSRGAVAERRDFEISLGMAAGRNEASGPRFIFFVACAFLCAALAAVLFAVKKRAAAFASLVVLCAFLVILVISGRFLSRRYGIFKGGDIHAVPDESSGLVATIASGGRVKVDEAVGAWMYIRYGDISGWVSSDAVILIN